MSQQTFAPGTVTVTPVADGLAYVYGRVVGPHEGGQARWEYLGSHASREGALEQARRVANGAEVRMEGRAETTPVGASQEGIGATRPPADS